MTRLLFASLFALASTLPLVVACATTKPYILNDTTLAVSAVSSATHTFDYVRLYAERGELVLYGKVTHRHEASLREPQVDAAITDAAGRAVAQFSLNLVERGKRRRGWYGASFRARLPRVSVPTHSVSLAFHEAEASPGCGQNAALRDTSPTPTGSE